MSVVTFGLLSGLDLKEPQSLPESLEAYFLRYQEWTRATLAQKDQVVKENEQRAVAAEEGLLGARGQEEVRF